MQSLGVQEIKAFKRFLNLTDGNLSAIGTYNVKSFKSYLFEMNLLHYRLLCLRRSHYCL